MNYAAMLFIATTITYMLAGSYLDPRLNYDKTNPRLDWDSINAQLTSMNINPDQSVFSRYWIWLKGVVLHWDWGYNASGGPSLSGGRTFGTMEMAFGTWNWREYFHHRFSARLSATDLLKFPA